MKEFISKLGINLTGTMVEGNYVIDIPDSDVYSKVFTLLDNSELVTVSETQSVVNEDNAVSVFVNPLYTLSLIGDLENDVYTLVVSTR